MGQGLWGKEVGWGLGQGGGSRAWVKEVRQGLGRGVH